MKCIHYLQLKTYHDPCKALFAYPRSLSFTIFYSFVLNHYEYPKLWAPGEYLYVYVCT